MARLKIYYPENQIIRNLTALPKQWMLEDGTEYVGPYHRYSSGEVYTESGWNEFQSKKLIPYRITYQSPGNLTYDKLTKTKVLGFTAPTYYFPILTEDDYVNGTVDRYFVQRRNLTNPVYSIIEVSQNQFNTIKLTGDGINGNLYSGIILPWKLTGPRFDVVSAEGVRLEPGVESTNKRVVDINSIKMPGIENYLTDYIELSVHWPATPQIIKDKFL